MSENKANIYYYDIGDYLSRDEKLKIISDFKSAANIKWNKLTPNEHGDWISQRNDKFSEFIPLSPEKKFDEKSQSFFTTQAIGVATNRDPWMYNFSKQKCKSNVDDTLDYYNTLREEYIEKKKTQSNLNSNEYFKGSMRINWTVNIKKSFISNKVLSNNYDFRLASYRPFQKQNLLYCKDIIERPGIFDKLFPTADSENLMICVSCVGNAKELSVLIINSIVDLHFNGDTQCFPLYWYEEKNTKNSEIKKSNGLGFDESETEINSSGKYIRHDAVCDFIFNRAREKYGDNLVRTKEDIFYYVYGILHEKEYRLKFANDLKKMLPRLPLVAGGDNFKKFRDSGRKLAELHINYETLPHLACITVESDKSGTNDSNLYKVEKMRFATSGNEKDKTNIIYNNRITIRNIPLKAYDYIVNGRSAIEWIMEQYRIKTHAESGITNDPNDWAREHNKSRYILDLLLSVINLSIQTVDIVNSLPKVEWDKE